MNAMGSGGRQEGFTFSMLPQPYRRADYQVATEKFLNRVTRIPGVVSVYQIGDVKWPGLSDLDFIVVLDDAFRHRLGNDYSVDYFDAETTYLLGQMQLYLSRSVMRHVLWINPTFRLSRVAGQSLEILEPSPEGRPGIHLAVLMDNSFWYDIRMLVASLATRRIPVKVALSKLKGMKYANEHYVRVTGSSPAEWEALIQEIEELRARWFDGSPREGALPSLIVRAVTMCFERAWKLAAYLRDAGIFIPPAARPGEVVGCYRDTSSWYPLDTVFVSDGDPRTAVERSLAHYRKSHRMLQFLPAVFSIPLRIYGECSGPLSRHIRRHLRLYGDPGQLAWKDPFALRIDLLNQYHRFAQRHCLFQTARFQTYGAPTETLASRASYLWLKGRSRVHKLLGLVPK